MARRLKQPAVRALVQAAIADCGERVIPLTDLARDPRLRGVDFGRIMSACSWLSKRRVISMGVHNFHGDIVTPIA